MNRNIVLKKDLKDVVEVVIGFDTNREEIVYIKSDFMDNEGGYKDPIGYTAKLLQMGLEKWIREKIGIFCPSCEAQMDEGWAFCPNCGWSAENE